jgi:hypothetical protein
MRWRRAAELAPALYGGRLTLYGGRLTLYGGRLTLYGGRLISQAVVSAGSRESWTGALVRMTVSSGRGLDQLRGHVGNLVQAQFLALVQVGAGQGQHQQDRGPGPPQARAAIQSRGGAAGQQPSPRI